MAVAGVEIGGIRTLLIVPMVKDDVLVGLMGIFRQEVRSFTPKQIELVQNFAAQAVIAIENTRLLNELRQRTDDLTESLEQQTATSEVLRVISSSPDELGTVFEVILDNAVRICNAKFGNLWLREGNKFRIVAIMGGSEEYRDYLFSDPLLEPDARSTMGRAVHSQEVVQVEDISTAPTYGLRIRVATIEIAKGRTLVAVPMLKDDQVVGIIAIYRQEVRPFTDKQIELLRSFANQAVIAIENTRLLNELRQRTNDLTESLEQQTATSEVLAVISKSSGELQPVFDAMLENATRLCEASYGTLWLHEGEGRMRAAALHGGLPDAYLKTWGVGRVFRPKPSVPSARAMSGLKPIQLVDLKDDQSYLDDDPLAVAAVDVAGIRSIISVPMIKGDAAIGAMTIYRREVRPFTNK